MECKIARSWLFRLLDDELPEREKGQLVAHLGACASCAEEWRILSLPQRIGKAIPLLQPSPFFYQRLRVRIESEKQNLLGWQVILGLWRQAIPALATVTLILVSLFAYAEFHNPRGDLYSAYDSIFLAADRQERMVIADDSEITDESVLMAVAEGEAERISYPGVTKRK